MRRPSSGSVSPSLQIPDTLLLARPSLRGYAGKPVIAGPRPEGMEDASLVASANGCCLDVDLSLAEPMGAELICHFAIDASPITGATAQAATGEAMIATRLSPRSGAQTGKPLRIAVDAERMHFFDPETEESIW